MAISRRSSLASYRERKLRPLVASSAALLLISGLVSQGCGSDTPGFEDIDPTGRGDGGGGSSSGNFEPTDGSQSSGGSSSGNTEIQPLDIEPAEVTITVRKVNGTFVANEPVTFKAKREGVEVADAVWFLEQGELGELTAAGVFTANGVGAGEGTIVATANGGRGTAKVLVKLESEHSAGGTSDGSSENCASPAGCGGVGGEPLGGAPSAADLEKLKTAEPEADQANFSWLYPYDKTVFPRGTLSPLLQWDWNKTAKAISISVSEPNLKFEGYYSYSGAAYNAADAKRRLHVDQAVWRAALQANDGSAYLNVSIKLLGTDDKVYGPYTRQIVVSPAPLTGTVYYNSYNSQLTGAGTPSGELGGVLSIKVASGDPAEAGTPRAALPARLTGQKKCTGCHVVSADGSSLFVQDGTRHTDPQFDINYPDSMSFDLTKAPEERGDGSTTSLAQTPENANKFLWAAPYPDGSFVLASDGLTREARLAPPSALFAKTDGAPVEATGLPADLSAATPTFSPDGRQVAFNLWRGTVPNASANGQSLVIYDFSCGATPGSVKCGDGAPKVFSNPRVVHNDASRYPGWVSFLADNSGVIFQNGFGSAGLGYPKGFSSCTVGDDNDAHQSGSWNGSGPVPGGITAPLPNNYFNCHLSTWYKQYAEIALTGPNGTTQDLKALNGLNPDGSSYLPAHTTPEFTIPNTNTNPFTWTARSNATFNDARLNYQPTVNPVPSGGYFWVVFTSRRRYGNVMNLHPFHETPQGNSGQAGSRPPWPVGSHQKKLWVAAIDVNTGEIDRSHPPFYLPGQELAAGNSRAFWSVDPCRPNGSSCETGDQCCGGSCRRDGDNALTCQPPPEAECKPEFDSCVTDADCCGTALTCISNRCARRGPVVPN